MSFPLHFYINGPRLSWSQLRRNGQGLGLGRTFWLCWFSSSLRSARSGALLSLVGLAEWVLAAVMCPLLSVGILDAVEENMEGLGGPDRQRPVLLRDGSNDLD